MLDHIGLTVSDIDRSKAFFGPALAPLGITLQMEVTAEQTGHHAHVGYGVVGKPFFWVGGGQHISSGVHVAFSAKTRAEVNAFYQAAMAAGGRDNGGPGLRPHYHPNYYGAFVLCPDGNNVEAVCHLPE
ncbi:VOC family protein [Chitinimonas sp.]|uniref:VOC family protein n=1 Tax=Chitinimonas sp. TaxID=1934313 RepID=UPI002F936D9F